MPQIVVLTDSPKSSEEVVYRERVASSCLESEHFSQQLLERVNWAVEDADAREHETKAQGAPVEAPAQPEPQPAWHPPLSLVE